jgi:hypothetical protein
MTKTPHRRNEGTGEAQRVAVENDHSASSAAPTCPQSEDCTRWKELPGERVECRACYQTFDRATMAEIFAGRA